MLFLLCRQYESSFYPNLLPVLSTSFTSLITLTSPYLPPKSTLYLVRISTTLGLWLFFFWIQMCFGYMCRSINTFVKLTIACKLNNLLSTKTFFKKNPHTGGNGVTTTKRYTFNVFRWFKEEI